MHFPRTLICLMTCLALPGFAISAPLPSAPAASPAASPAAKPRPLPFHSVIVSVDPKTRTFTMGKKVIRRVHVLPETKLFEGDTKPAAFNALAPNLEIRGSLRKRADGDYDAVTLKLGLKPAPSPSPTAVPAKRN